MSFWQWRLSHSGGRPSESGRDDPVDELGGDVGHQCLVRLGT